MIEPLINNGELALTPVRDLVGALHIVTQIQTLLSSGINLYNPALSGELMTYLNSTTKPQRNIIANLVSDTLNKLVLSGDIKSFAVGVGAIVANSVLININAVDNENNKIALTWTN